MIVIVLQLYQIVMLAKENVFIVIMIATARFTETKSVEVVEGALKEVCIRGKKGHVDQNVLFIIRCLLGGFRDLGGLEVLRGLGDLGHLGDLQDLLGGFNRPRRRRITTASLSHFEDYLKSDYKMDWYEAKAV